MSRKWEYRSSLYQSEFCGLEGRGRVGPILKLREISRPTVNLVKPMRMSAQAFDLVLT